jgi:Tfp pilus assembly protein PilE
MGKTVWEKGQSVPFIEGLTLVEVMVGMLVSAICLGTALQAYIGAVSIRAKSQQLDTAIAKMEADAETIRQLSKECLNPLDLKSLDCRNPKNLAVVCQGNYAQSLIKKVVRPDSTSESASPSTDERATKPSPESSSLALQNAELSKPQLFIFPTSSELPQDDQLTRKMDIAPDAPNIVKISYTLTRPSSLVNGQTSEPITSEEKVAKVADRTTLARLSLTLMPSAALVCP